MKFGPLRAQAFTATLCDNPLENELRNADQAKAGTSGLTNDPPRMDHAF
jgi:hypothetical protein